ncbi:hypothetical protein [Yinghuangia seranimata]|uniref:hypothetical protein n=1 Tax=Yinghuangia seranimata TaxID=408067 RepID=UPI00248C4208|nr:hypothetical protein [Yinghuangia seranimata]MDI2128334.1 hypothetical protein [Yinghuangia seranimata]
MKKLPFKRARRTLAAAAATAAIASGITLATGTSAHADTFCNTGHLSPTYPVHYGWTISMCLTSEGGGYWNGKVQATGGYTDVRLFVETGDACNDVSGNTTSSPGVHAYPTWAEASTAWNAYDHGCRPFVQAWITESGRNAGAALWYLR